MQMGKTNVCVAEEFNVFSGAILAFLAVPLRIISRGTTPPSFTKIPVDSISRRVQYAYGTLQNVYLDLFSAIYAQQSSYLNLDII